MSKKRRTLRRQLFRSHLVVMVVAVLVMALVSGLAALVLFEIGAFDKNSSGNNDDGAGAAFVLGLLIAIVSAVTAASFVAAIVARRIARPIAEVGEATRRLAGGNYAVRVPASRSAELTELAEDVNALALELETTEQRRLQLIGDLAHELRTPLSTIEGSMEALMDGVVAPTDEVFASIARESARLKRLAFDLSNLSRAQEGAYPLTRTPIDLGETVIGVTDRLRHQFEAKKVELALHLPANVTIRADADRVAQILTNVIGNALSYTDSGGQVSVELAAGVDAPRVSVRDTGRGLAADELPRVFERFYRADRRAGQGTGVGLTIARELVRAHGGEVTVRSAGRGMGTSVDVVLPRG